MKTLTLLRHAKAVPPGGDLEDHARPLAPRGHAAAAAVGAATGAPDLVLCSTALRTRQTLEDAMRAWSAPPPVRWDEALYLAGPALLLRRVEAVDDAVGSVWLIGHNPGLHELALSLAAPAEGRSRFPDLALRFPTACRAVFRFETECWRDIATARAVLTEFAPTPD